MKKMDCIWIEKGVLSNYDLCFWFNSGGEDKDCNGCQKYEVEEPSKSPHEFTITIEGRSSSNLESEVEEQLRASLAPILKEYDIQRIKINFIGSRSGSVIELSNKKED